MRRSISEVDCFVLKLRHDTPYLGHAAGLPDAGYATRPPWRSLYSARFETLLVRLTADDGTTGWGEALAPVAPEVPAEIVRRMLAPALRGADPRHVQPLTAGLRELMRERGHLGGHQADAIAAVDIALWDLAARLADLPVHVLLGGAFRQRIPTYVSGLPCPTDPERAALAAELAGAGATTVKLHLGHGVDVDLATVAAVRAAAPTLQIAVDAHWAYRLVDAIRLARSLVDLGGVAFLEAPLAPEDRDGHAELARRVDLPIAVGETMRHRFEFGDWLSARAVGLVQPDVARTGISEAMAIGGLAAAHYVPVAPHHSVGLTVALAAGLQVSAATDQLLWFEGQRSSLEVGQRILTRPLPGEPDGFPVPAGPGLGIDVDPVAVANLAEEQE